MQIDGMSILIKQQKNAAENLAADPISSFWSLLMFMDRLGGQFSLLYKIACAISYAILLSIAIQAR